MYLTPHGFAKLDLDENSKHLLSLVAFLQLDHDHGIPESVLTQPHELASLKYLNDKEAYVIKSPEQHFCFSKSEFS